MEGVLEPLETVLGMETVAEGLHSCTEYLHEVLEMKWKWLM